MNEHDILVIIKNRIIEHKLVTNKQPQLIVISSDFLTKSFNTYIKDITKYKVAKIDDTYIKFPQVEGESVVEGWTFYLYDIKVLITDKPNTIEVF